MADKTLLVNGQPFTFNRDRLADVRTLTVSEPPFSDSTTRLQVTVSGAANISGVYERSSTSSNQYRQVNGYGSFSINEIRVPPDNYVEWNLVDGSDNNPSISFQVTGSTNTLPWQALSEFAANGITLSPVSRTITANRTAPVITSDRAGQSRPLLSKLVGRAAAAYSLRDLNDKQGNNKVVRVRRESDNHERDFLAKEISNGTLTSFVNAQVTAPLDIREIADSNSDGNNDGRVGNFLIAKAAYSLRSLGTRQATITSSGDTDGVTSGKFVCQVRRSSDDKIKSFTADEIADGTLLAFTNEDYVKYTSDFSSGTNSWGSSLDDLTAAGNIDGIGGLDDNLRLTIGSATSQHRAFRTAIFPINQKINFSARVFIPSSNSVVDSFRIADASGTQIIASTTPAQDQWVTVTASNVTPTNSSGQLRLFLQDGGVSNFAGNGSDVIYLREVVVTQVTSDGHVKTWYDQSVSDQAGNTPTGNHATQTSAANQPKIVENGTLLTLSGKPTIKPDGTNDFLINESSIWDTISNSALSCFTLTEKSSVTNKILWAIGSSSNEDGDWLIGGGGTAGNVQFRGGRVNSTSSSIGTSGIVLLTAIDVSGGDGFVNGTAIGSPSSTTPNVTADRLVLFNRRGSSSSSTFTNQSLSEVIFYGDDQTENRTAIEANIGEHYSIDLPAGVDPLNNEVDGFVETWYDQSGNGNNATQATASKQPKIVSSGTLLNELDFDGSDDELDFTALNESDISIFSVANFDDADGQDRIISGQGNNSGNGFGKASATRGFFRANAQSARQPVLNATISVDQDTLLSFIRASDTATFFTNGTASDSFTDSGAFGAGSIGGAGSKIDGSIKELIIYVSNQTANRPAIEANLSNQYGIALS